MTFFTTDQIPAVVPLEGVTRRVVHLDKAMLTIFDFAPHSVVPEHKHPHEQITLVLEGELDFILNGETKRLRAGDGVCVPSNVPHGVIALEKGARAIDSWAPAREDYL